MSISAGMNAGEQILKEIAERKDLIEEESNHSPRVAAIGCGCGGGKMVQILSSEIKIDASGDLSTCIIFAKGCI